jgi:hypothetical protein
MNQQRSRRFRSAQEAKEKEEARQESLLLWKGKKINLGVVYRLHVFSHGEGTFGSRAAKRSLGLECYYSWNPIHGSPCFFIALLGCPKNEYRPRLEKCAELSFQSIKLSSFYRFRFSYRTLQYPEKESIKLWTLLDDSEAILVTIQIRAMLYMAW